MAEESQLEYEDEQIDGRPAQAVVQDSGSDLPIKQGGVFGAIAVVATYLAHLLVTAMATAQASPATYTEGAGEDATLVVTDLVASWIAAGWSYLAVFGAGFEADGERATLGDAPNHAAGFGDFPFLLADTLLFVLSVGLVIAAGYAIAKYTDTDDAAEAVKAAVTVVPAYLVFAAIVAFAMTTTYSDPALVDSVASSTAGLESADFFNSEGDVTTDIEFGPSTSDAILFAGIVVPAVLAAIGGLLTQREDALDTVMAKVTDR